MPDRLAQPLAGRVLVVTGGSSGIGRAIALAAARAGADVALTYRTSQAAAHQVTEAVRALGRRCEALRVDASRADDIAATGPAVLEALGRLDVWVNNAGADVLTGTGARLSQVEKLDLLLSVDLRGTVLSSWHAAEVLAAQPDGGVIVNTSWDHVLTGMAGVNPQMFAAVKGGVLAFSRSLARSVAPKVRVNVVAPGWIATAFGDGLDESSRRVVEAATPLARWGTPDDVADTVIFLASPSARFLTGQTILVGGGVVMS
jgi:3-oxoacyl-[acyl-carrier protein] reductase